MRCMAKVDKKCLSPPSGWRKAMLLLRVYSLIETEEAGWQQGFCYGCATRLCHSQATMATAVETFKDFLCPAIGICT